MNQRDMKILSYITIGILLIANVGHIGTLYFFSWVMGFNVSHATLFMSTCIANLHAFVLILMIAGLTKGSNKSK